MLFCRKWHFCREIRALIAGTFGSAIRRLILLMMSEAGADMAAKAEAKPDLPKKSVAEGARLYVDSVQLFFQLFRRDSCPPKPPRAWCLSPGTLMGWTRPTWKRGQKEFARSSSKRQQILFSYKRYFLLYRRVVVMWLFRIQVIPETFSYIESKMPNYICLAAKQHNYFVATLLRKGRVYLDHHTVKDFHTSRYWGNK